MSRAGETAFRLCAAVESDIDSVARLEAEAQPHPWSAALLAAELQNPRSTLLLATSHEAPAQSDAGAESEALAGYVVFWLVADELHVLNVATAPAWRRRGVASLLLDEAERRAWFLFEVSRT